MAQKQPFLKRVRNSSLVEHPCADNVTGLSMIPKLRIHTVRYDWEGSIPLTHEGVPERGSGGDGRENAGISNAKTGEIPVRRKPKVSWVKAICPG